MTIFKVTVKSSFHVEANTMADAKRIVDIAIEPLPASEVNIKATKKIAMENL